LIRLAKSCKRRLERVVLLERDSEVLALERTFGGLAAGRGAVVVVEAPAGLGKTTSDDTTP
jgi:hypothetical protein